MTKHKHVPAGRNQWRFPSIIKGCLESRPYFTKSKRDKEEYTEMGKEIKEL